MSNLRLRAAANARTLGGPAVRMLYRIEVFGVHELPARGPLLVVGDQPELLAGTVIKAVAPRPMHVIASEAVARVMPPGVIGLAGDIVNPAPGISAAEEALSLLECGEAVVVLGDQPAVGYLAAASRAPIATVAVFGAAGRVPTDPPALRTRIDVRFGPATQIEVPGDPLELAVIRGVGEQVRQHLADARAVAWARHGGQ